MTTSGRYGSCTARLYQAGLELADAARRGADASLFQELDAEFKGGSIPVHLLHGFPKTEPYSCTYHTGGNKGARLRQLAASLRT